MEHPPAAGYALEDIPRGQSWAMMTFNVCATQAPTQVTGIELKDSRGLEVVDWGLHAWPPGEQLWGSWQGRVLDRDGFSQEPVTGICSDPDAVDSVVYLSVKRTAALGIAYGFYVEYDGGRVFLPFRPLICAQKCPNWALDALP